MAATLSLAERDGYELFPSPEGRGWLKDEVG